MRGGGFLNRSSHNIRCCTSLWNAGAQKVEVGLGREGRSLHQLGGSSAGGSGARDRGLGQDAEIEVKADQGAAFADRIQETLTQMRLMCKRAFEKNNNYPIPDQRGFDAVHHTANSDDDPKVFRLRAQPIPTVPAST